MNERAINCRALPVSGRIERVEAIWDSIAEWTQDAPVKLSPEDRAELHRRLAAHRSDPSSSVPWEQVRSKLFNRNMVPP